MTLVPWYYLAPAMCMPPAAVATFTFHLAAFHAPLAYLLLPDS